MKKIFFYPLSCIAILSVTSCATNITKLNTSGSYTYKIDALGLSKDIQTETITTASNLCRTMNKDYKFIRNTILPKSVMGIELISYDLVFSCVDPGSAQSPPPDAAAGEGQENAGGPEPSPDKEKEEKLAATKADAGKDKKTGTTGDTPGEPESLGGPPPSKEAEQEKQEEDIIEEKILE